MTEKFKISVLMPAYNVEKHVGKAIETILNQTYRNIELLADTNINSIFVLKSAWER